MVIGRMHNGYRMYCSTAERSTVELTCVCNAVRLPIPMDGYTDTVTIW